MTYTDDEIESMRVNAWKRKAKGKPIRWRMLRDLVSMCRLAWLTTSELQIAMRRVWALKNKTTRDMLEELEDEKAIKQEKDEKDHLHKWGATLEGANFWIGSSENIPASLVEVVEATKLVSRLEV